VQYTQMALAGSLHMLHGYVGDSLIILIECYCLEIAGFGAADRGCRINVPRQRWAS
jgi:hypothetical protein